MKEVRYDAKLFVLFSSRGAGRVVKPTFPPLPSPLSSSFPFFRLSQPPACHFFLSPSLKWAWGPDGKGEEGLDVEARRRRFRGQFRQGRTIFDRVGSGVEGISNCAYSSEKIFLWEADEEGFRRMCRGVLHTTPPHRMERRREKGALTC